MLKALEGKKTYLAAALGIAVALAGAYFGVISNDAAVELFVGSLAMVGFRSAMAKQTAEAAVARATEEGAKRRPAGK